QRTPSGRTLGEAPHFPWRKRSRSPSACATSPIRDRHSRHLKRCAACSGGVIELSILLNRAGKYIASSALREVKMSKTISRFRSSPNDYLPNELVDCISRAAQPWAITPRSKGE